MNCAGGFPSDPAQPGRWEHEYARKGGQSFTGRRHVEASARCTLQNWVRWICGMLEQRRPQAEPGVLVLVVGLSLEKYERLEVLESDDDVSMGLDCRHVLERSDLSRPYAQRKMYPGS